MKALMGIIPMVSVGIMVVWGVLADDWGHSWLAVFIGGILMGCLSIYYNAKEKENKPEDTQKEDTTEK